MEKVIVDKKERIVKLNFNNNFYKESLIDQAIQNFSEICDITKENTLICLKPKNKKIKLEKIGYEFYNHVLALIKNN